MRNCVCFLLMILLNLAANAQQDPHFSFEKLTQLTVNPGVAGSSGSVSALILNRYQWSGFEGAPETTVFSVETTTGIFGGTGGIGLNIIRDQEGYATNQLINLNYSYISTLKWGDLGVGLSLGAYNKKLAADWSVPNGGSYVNPGSDPVIPTSDVTQVALDVGIGAYLRSNDFFAGLSVTHINQAGIKYDEVEFDFLKRHFYLSGGYNIKMTDPLFVLQPSAFYGTDFVSSSLSLNIDLMYNDKFGGGLGYRTGDAFMIKLNATILNDIKIGYSYDLITSSIGSISNGSHEFFVNYSFDLGKKRQKKYKSIRFL